MTDDEFLKVYIRLENQIDIFESSGYTFLSM